MVLNISTTRGYSHIVVQHDSSFIFRCGIVALLSKFMRGRLLIIETDDGIYGIHNNIIATILNFKVDANGTQFDYQICQRTSSTS